MTRDPNRTTVEGHMSEFQRPFTSEMVKGIFARIYHSLNAAFHLLVRGILDQRWESGKYTSHNNKKRKFNSNLGPNGGNNMALIL
jgi:hypothetical protein